MMLLAIIWILCVAVGYSIGKPKGRGFDSLILSALLGPFGWIAAYMMPAVERSPRDSKKFCIGLALGAGIPAAGILILILLNL